MTTARETSTVLRLRSGVSTASIIDPLTTPSWRGNKRQWSTRYRGWWRRGAGTGSWMTATRYDKVGRRVPGRAGHHHHLRMALTGLMKHALDVHIGVAAKVGRAGRGPRSAQSSGESRHRSSSSTAGHPWPTSSTHPRWRARPLTAGRRLADTSRRGGRTTGAPFSADSPCPCCANAFVMSAAAVYEVRAFDDHHQRRCGTTASVLDCGAGGSTAASRSGSLPRTVVRILAPFPVRHQLKRATVLRTVKGSVATNSGRE